MLNLGDTIKTGWRYKVLNKEDINPGVLASWGAFCPDLIKLCGGRLGMDCEWWEILFLKGAPKDLIGKKAKIYIRDYRLSMSGETFEEIKFYKFIE